MLSARTQATLMLTLRLDAGATGDLDSLETREWNTLARWLKDRQLAPEDLVSTDPVAVLEEWADTRIGRDRLLRLLGRGPELAVKLERWLGTGIWIVGRSDPAYPSRLKQHLGDSAPPVLFGYGEQSVLQRAGVAIVGSRDASQADMTLAEHLGAAVSDAGFVTISGGAQGIDQQAASGALQRGGPVVAILADGMVRTANRKDQRSYLLQGALTLVTPYSPEAGFSAGNAMGRNRLIYCLSRAAVAVSSSAGKGGTFNGASEALRRGWVPVWTVPNDDPQSGNMSLIERGAGVMPPLADLDVKGLFDGDIPRQPAKPAQAPLI